MTQLFAFITFALTDLTKGQRNGERGRRRDTEDSGQLEERVVDIYESVDLLGLVPRPLQVMRDNPTGRQAQGTFDHAMKFCETQIK